jgi:hypothetical protein
MPTRRKPVMKWVSTIASCNCARWRSMAGRYRLAGDFGQREGEGIAGIEAQQMVEAKIRHAGARFSRSAALCSERPMTSVATASPERGDFGLRRAAQGQRRAFLIDQMAVERIADVGQHHRRRPKASIHSLIASMSPGVSIDDASTLTCRRRPPPAARGPGPACR